MLLISVFCFLICIYQCRVMFWIHMHYCNVQQYPVQFKISFSVCETRLTEFLRKISGNNVTLCKLPPSHSKERHLSIRGLLNTTEKNIYLTSLYMCFPDFSEQFLLEMVLFDISFILSSSMETKFRVCFCLNIFPRFYICVFSLFCSFSRNQRFVIVTACLTVIHCNTSPQLHVI